jgi:hypothetical protein
MKGYFVERLQDRYVIEVYRAVKQQLELLPPNGAGVHKKNGHMTVLHLGIQIYERTPELRDETFSRYRQRDPESYSRKVDRLYQIIKEFGVRL